MTQIEITKKVIEALDQLNIPYMITGAVAASYYGKPRFTHDIDLVVSIKKESAPLIEKLFEDEFYVSAEGILDALEHHTMFNLINHDTGIKIDCWIIGSDDYDLKAFERRKLATIFDAYMYISAPEDVILSKLRWFKESKTEKHLDDARGIFEVQQANLDTDYLKTWSNKLSVEDLLERVL